MFITNYWHCGTVFKMLSFGFDTCIKTNSQTLDQRHFSGCHITLQSDTISVH